MTAHLSSFMAEAIALARRGMERGDGGPFGAVVVRNGKIIGRGWNRVLADSDPTAHAEITAIRDACRHVGGHWLTGCRIYVSCEPCPMCLGAIYWARIEALVFAAERGDAADIGFIDRELYEQICLEPGTRSLEIRQEGRDRALAVMRAWPEVANGRY